MTQLPAPMALSGMERGGRATGLLTRATLRRQAGVLIATACVLASVALGGAVWGIRERAGSVWARRYFFGTLIYLPLLLGVLAVDVL